MQWFDSMNINSVARFIFQYIELNGALMQSERINAWLSNDAQSDNMLNV